MSRVFEQWMKDVRLAVRGLRRHPGFTLASVATLALGIGANSALFSVVNAVLLTPLPYDRPKELVVVGGGPSGVEPMDLRASGPEYADLVEGVSSLRSLGAAYVIDANITNGEQPEHVTAALVTTGFFSMLEATPALGRDFVAGDAGVDIGYVMILSHGAWQRMLGGDPSAVGSTIHLDEDPFTVVGVMPEGFAHPGQPSTSPVEVWIPFDPMSALFGNRRYRPLDVYGRLAEGISIDQAQAELRSLGDRIREADPGAYPPAGEWSIGVLPLMERVVGGVRPMLFILIGSVSFVLLVACTNVASLILTRGSTRTRELATRAALGAGRGRLAVQMFTESLVLALSGGALGLMLTSVGTDALQALAETELPRIQEATIDGRVLLFTFVTAVTASVLCGLAPMWQLSKPDVRALAEGAPRSGGAGSRMRDAMVIGQISMSLVLVICAGLTARSFGRLLDVPLGFDADRVLAMQVWLPRPNVPETGRYFHPKQRISLFENALTEMEALLGVEGAAVVSHLPLRATASTTVRLLELEVEEARVAEIRIVSPGYFEVMGISLDGGRFFESTDDTTAAPVVLINEALADHYPATSRPLGRTLRVGGDETAREVVGIVSDVRQHALDVAPRPAVYLPYRQGVGRTMTFVLRTSDTPEIMVQPVTRALQRIDPDLPVHGVTSMQDVVANTVAQRRTLMLLLSLFAMLSLLLGVLGVYAVIAFAARQRLREVAVRRALGADEARVTALFLRKAAVLGLAGVGIGLAGAAVSTSVLQSFLFEVGRLDPLVFGAATVLWVATALIAALIPARRAVHVDPGAALRGE